MPPIPLKTYYSHSARLAIVEVEIKLDASCLAITFGKAKIPEEQAKHVHGPVVIRPQGFFRSVGVEGHSCLCLVKSLKSMR